MIHLKAAMLALASTLMMLCIAFFVAATLALLTGWSDYRPWVVLEALTVVGLFALVSLSSRIGPPPAR